MKILHINSYYHKGKFYKNLFDLQDRHMDIDVYVPINRKYNYDDFDYGQYTHISKDFVTIDRAAFHVKQLKIFSAIQRKFFLADYDLVHAHTLFTNGNVAYKIFKKYQIPYIVAVRNTDVNMFFEKLKHLHRLGIDILAQSKKIIFLSEGYKNMVIDAYVPARLRDVIREKSVVIPNGIDQFWLNNINEDKAGKCGGSLKLCTVGEISDNKNQVVVSEICKKLIERGYKVEYFLAGKIMNKAGFSKMLREPYIEYLGVLGKEQLITCYRNSDIFILLSKTESFGLVYAEAMSQGLPLLYTKGQGFDKQFDDGVVGFPVEQGDIEDAIDKIETILGNYTEISNNCIRQSKKFCWELIEAQYFDIYKTIIA